MSIQKDITELVDAGVISPGTADDIKQYYAAKGTGSPNKLLAIFSVLGAILTGLGIILIIAHNWNHLSRSIKLLFAFLPLVTGQLCCLFLLVKKKQEPSWKEAAAAFLFFGVGAAISLVSQVYNISGDLRSFLLTWMLLCLPVIYLLRSSVVSLLYLAGITWYAVLTDYWTSFDERSYYYWLLLLLALPHYYWLYRQKPTSNFMVLHNWVLPLSVTICLGTLAQSHEELMFVAYLSLFGLFYITGTTVFFERQRAISNGYRFTGSLGTIVLLLLLSFNYTWEGILREREAVFSSELIASIFITVWAAIALYLKKTKDRPVVHRPMEFVFLVFVLCFMIGTISAVAVVMVNLLVLATGVLTIIAGTKEDHLGIVNYGLMIIAALVICRFFDTDLSFVIRGLLFVIVGLGFFFTNYQLIQKRKQHAEE